MSSKKFGDIMTNAEAYALLNDVNEDQLFYASKQHGKFLDLLTHLSRYSNLLLTVVGPAGSGKTHIKNKFLSNLDSGVLVCKMHGDNVADVKDLSARIAQTFNLENHVLSTVNTLIGELRQNVEAFMEDGKTCLILIDNAEKLTDASLQLLLELANTVEDNQRPHIVLIGRNELTDRLKSSPHHNLYEPVGHLLELSGFNEEETANYIDYRLKSVGINVFPFDDYGFNEIYHKSGGWPGRLNNILLNYFKDNKKNSILPSNKLTSIKRDAKKRDNKNKSNTSYIFPLVSAVIFILLAVAMFFFNSHQRNPLEKDPSEKREATVLGKKIKSASSNSPLEDLDTNRKVPHGLKNSGIVQTGRKDNPFIQNDEQTTKVGKPSLAKPKVEDIFGTPTDNQQNSEQIKNVATTDVPAVKPDKAKDTEVKDTDTTDLDPAFKNIDSNLPGEPKVIDLSDIAPEPVDEDGNIKVEDTKKVNSKVVEKPADTTASNQQTDANAVAKTQEKVNTPSETTTKPKIPQTVKNVATTVKKTTSPYKKEAWLLQQPRYKYTLQFFGSHSETNVQGFIKNQPYRYRKDFIYYEVKLNNRPWFVAVHGTYNNRPDAVKAIQGLPTSLKQMEPWAHSFGGIQDDIRDR